MDRIIKTNLKTDESYNVLISALGQMSDGWWKNNASMEEYWRFVTVGACNDGKLAFFIDERFYVQPSPRRTVYNKLRDMRNSEVLSFFAKKIRYLLSKEFVGKKMANSAESEWFSHDRTIYVSDVKDVVDALNASAIAAGIAESTVD